MIVLCVIFGILKDVFNVSMRILQFILCPLFGKTQLGRGAIWVLRVEGIFVFAAIFWYMQYFMHDVANAYIEAGLSPGNPTANMFVAFLLSLAFTYAFQALFLMILLTFPVACREVSGSLKSYIRVKTEQCRKHESSV